MSCYVCEFPGCNRGRDTGHALYRTSPKGDLFRGRCADHMGEPVDEGVALIAGAIEDRNLARGEGSGETDG